MGNTESQTQGPSLKPPRPESYPPQPPLQIQSKVKEQKNTQNLHAFQSQLPPYYIPPPQSQEQILRSQLKTQSPQVLADSMILNQRQPQINSSSITSSQNSQRNITSPPHYPQVSLLTKLQTSQTSQPKTSDSLQLDPVPLPLAILKFSPSIKSSILYTPGTQKIPKKFKISNKLLELDQLKVQLRKLSKQILTKLLPGFDNDIMKMNQNIQTERQDKLKNKNKVLFLLMQRLHYIRVCKRFLEYQEKIKSILLVYRKKDCLEDVTEAQVQTGLKIKTELEKFIKNIQGDLPDKGWVTLIDQPESKLYRSVVNSAICNQEVVSKFKQLEQSLVNPQVFQELFNQEMMESKTRRIGEKPDQNKLIQGPVDYALSNKGIKNPVS